MNISDLEEAARKYERQTGLALISSQTIKVDNLLRTKTVQRSLPLTVALKNLKRDILVGLAQAKGA